MSNVITDRVAFFLKDYPPFSFLNEEELSDIAQSITVRYCTKNEELFREGEANKGYCFILRQGSVRLYQEQDEKKILVDHCEPGDVFGVRSILTNRPYVMSGICDEESLIYALEIDSFRKFLENHQKFALFFASGYASGQAVARGENQEDYLKKVKPIREQALQYSEEVLTCSKETSILEAAGKMSTQGVGSILVINSEGHPIGIVTDTDLRNKVVAANTSLEQPVAEVMSSPVRAIGPISLLSEVQIEMIRSKVHHLVITEDGTENSKVVGIVSDHDIMVSMQNHPAALIKAIKYSNDPKKWAEIRQTAENLLQQYLKQEVSISLLSNLVTAINDTIIEKAIKLALEETPEAAAIQFAWLSLGSEGREEQLLRTDQDNAIVFEDGGDNERRQKILLRISSKVTDILEQCGFAKCPADIMASNPVYCQPLTKWKSYFSKWIDEPDPHALMNTTIFFDFRMTYGSDRIEKELSSFLTAKLSEARIFLNFLAKNATLNPAPLSFFKKFVVERTGEHKAGFDIKKRAMMPLSDIARVLALESGVTDTQNTVRRFRKLAQLDDSKSNLYEEAAQAYEIFMRVRTSNGLQNHDAGRFVDVENMNKLQKQILKNAFLPVKDLQEMMEVKFQLAYFS